MTKLNLVCRGCGHAKPAKQFPRNAEKRCFSCLEEDRLATRAAERRVNPHPLEILVNNGDIGKEELEAAEGIDLGYRAIVGPTNVRLMPWSERGYTWHPSNIALKISERESEYIQCFERWSDRWESKGHSTMPVIEVICDGVALRQVERRFCMKNGSAKSFICNALEEYVRMMGWRREVSAW